MNTAPQDPAVERALLAAVLLFAGGAPNLVHADLEAVGVTAETFFDPRHALIWEAMTALLRRSVPVDILTLGAELRAMERLNSVGGAQYLGELTDYLVTLAHAEAHAELAVDIARLRQAAAIALEMQARIARGGRPGDVLAEVRALAARIPSGENARKRSAMGDHAEAAWAEAERAMESYNAGTLVVAGFGVETLDGCEHTEGLLGGIFAQNVVTISGVPGAGKTTLAWQAVLETARQGAAALVFSTEMRGPQLCQRIAASLAGVSFQRLRAGRVSPEEATRIAHHLAELGRLPIHVIDTHVNGGRITADDVRARTMSAARRGRVGLVAVDYFQDMARLRGRERASVTEEQEERAAILHDTAVGADVPMIVVSSMNKGGQRAQGREGKSADNTDARGAGLDYASDVMAFLTRPEDGDLGDGRRRVRFEVTKSRYGKTGAINLIFDMRRGLFLPDTHHGEFAAPGPEDRYGDDYGYTAPGGEAE